MKLSPWEIELAFDSARTSGLDVAPAVDPTGALVVRVRNTSQRPVCPGALRLTAALGEPAGGGYLWIHGRYMQRDALVRRFGAPPETGYLGEHVAATDGGRRYISRGVAVLVLPGRSPTALLVGALRLDRFFVDVEVEVDHDERQLWTLSLVFELEATELAPGAELELPAVRLMTGRDPWELMAAWADEVGRAMGARVPGHVPTGWCSWYFFYNRVSEADVLANLAEMERSHHPAEVVQIDDGFQSATGDWLAPNERFPGGMRALADRIRAAGFTPGLWLAPLVLHESSATLREQPELALRRRDGERYWVDTWLGRCAVVDCTLPGTEAWLRRVVRTAVREWGYTYLKLDALAFAALPADLVRYARPTTGPAHLRRGLEIIREEAGDQTFILGCTCHFGSAIGVVDAMRVGPDVKALWEDGPRPSVRHAMRMTLQRNWMHRRWWINDPDCLIVREHDTTLSEAEVRFLCTGIALSGGMVVASDDLPRLSPARRELALALFPPIGVAARPLDPADGPVPSVWWTDRGEESLLGLLNWSEYPRVFELRAAENAVDFWTGLAAPAPLQLQPHEGRLFRLKNRLS
jgi:alpha-galactosidase